MSKFGKNIKKIRSAKKLTQSQFADIFKLNRTTVGAYEEGRAEPKIDTLIEIANYFGISIDKLLTKDLTVNEIFHFDSYTQINENSLLQSKKGIQIINHDIVNDYINNSESNYFFNKVKYLKFPFFENDNFVAFQNCFSNFELSNFGFDSDDIFICKKTNTIENITNNEAIVIEVNKSLLLIEKNKIVQNSNYYYDNQQIKSFFQIINIIIKNSNPFLSIHQKLNIILNQLNQRI